MAAVSSASDLAAAPSSKRSRGLADIDPKFVSNVSPSRCVPIVGTISGIRPVAHIIGPVSTRW